MVVKGLRRPVDKGIIVFTTNKNNLIQEATASEIQ